MKSDLKVDNTIIISLRAFEELHPGNIVRLYYGKAKQTTDRTKTIGIVMPLLNPKTVQRNNLVKVMVSGSCYYSGSFYQMDTLV